METARAFKNKSFLTCREPEINEREMFFNFSEISYGRVCNATSSHYTTREIFCAISSSSNCCFLRGDVDYANKIIIKHSFVENKMYTKREIY